jgi:hypothetical protein
MFMCVCMYDTFLTLNAITKLTSKTLLKIIYHLKQMVSIILSLAFYMAFTYTCIHSSDTHSAPLMQHVLS